MALKIVFLDAGQGDATLVAFPNGQLMLVDCGATKNRGVVKSQIAAGIERFLTPGHRHIDMVLVTHADEDHYNLLSEVMDALPGATVGDVRYGGDIELYKNKKESNLAYNWLKAHNATAFDPSHFGGGSPAVIGPAGSREEVKLYVLAANSTGNPALADGWSKNSNSVVVMVEYDKYKVFLMGDATSDTESFIISRCAATPAAAGVLGRTYRTSLKMGHHGSDTSSSQAWVQALTPDALFLSADTKTFGRYWTGIPSYAHLQQVLGWSPNVIDAGEHTVVVFEDASRRFDLWKTTKGVYSTLWKLLYNADGSAFDAAGGSWHLTVEWGGAVSVDST